MILIETRAIERVYFYPATLIYHNGDYLKQASDGIQRIIQ